MHAAGRLLDTGSDAVGMAYASGVDGGQLGHELAEAQPGNLGRDELPALLDVRVAVTAQRGRRVPDLTELMPHHGELTAM